MWFSSHVAVSIEDSVGGKKNTGITADKSTWQYEYWMFLLTSISEAGWSFYFLYTQMMAMW